MAETHTTRSRKTTIVDVAKAAGVSHATVSRVINNQGYVSDQTRQKVLDLVERMGYVTNVPARSLAGGSSYLFGMVVSGFYGHFLGELSQSIDSELSKASYNLAIFPTHNDSQKETWYITRAISGIVDGLLIVLPRNLNEYLLPLKTYNFPYVLVDSERADPDSSIISMTNWQGAYDATRYLLRLGHRRISHVMGPEIRISAQERLEGYRAALVDFDTPVDLDLVQIGNFRYEEGYSAGKNLLSLPEPPTAIFAANDLSAFGVLKAAQELGFNVPEDLSIVGFDDLPEAERANLTTVHVPIDLVGRLAARALIERINFPENAPQRVTVATSLTVRTTCAAPRSK